jgi:hypothetical protein
MRAPPSVQIREHRERTPSSWRPSVISAGLLVICYVLITALTGAHFMADTREYATHILEFQRAVANNLWDFGHLFWRPLGWLTFVLTKPVTRLFVGENERAQVIVTLIAITWICGLVSVVFFFDLTTRVVKRRWIALVATIAFLFADAFLNYVHAGCAYVPGLAGLIFGMWFLIRDDATTAEFWRVFLPSAACFAVAAFLWLPYGLVVPAAIASSFLMHDSNPRLRRIAWQTAGLCLIIGLFTYVVVVIGLRIRNFDDLKAWIVSAGHGQMQSRGLIRLAFSMPRSFINLGQDGVYFKRYLVHDPYAPVPLAALLKLGFWKLGLFYVFGAVLCIELVRSRAGRRMFLLLMSACVPIFIFALFIFEAGSIERYLPLFPFVFLAAAYALREENTRRLAKVVILSCFILMIAINGNAMRKSVLEKQHEMVARRIRDLAPLLKRESIVMTVGAREDISEFKMNFPLDPLNLREDFRDYGVVEIGAARLATWREDFAKMVRSTWAQGGDVWLSKRLLSARPRPEWNWVEGDDQRIKWTDLPSFFSQFDTAQTVGGEDGFLLLPNSSKNQQIVSDLVTHPPESRDR